LVQTHSKSFPTAVFATRRPRIAVRERGKWIEWIDDLIN
jgi:hypothetical protein